MTTFYKSIEVQTMDCKSIPKVEDQEKPSEKRVGRVE